MSDLIRREDAVSAISDLLMIQLQGKRLPTWNEVYNAINDIPSAEPERKFIPFEIALPNDRQKVLCVNKRGEMMVGGYLTNYGMTFPCYFENPIAWMPLPEPWRGER